MKTRLAIATVAESRDDFYERRKPLIARELQDLDWLRAEFECCESQPIRSRGQIKAFVEEARLFRAQALVIHIPIWGDPIFSVRLATSLKLPTLLLGNDLPTTSSIVGVLGAGGALDQVGIPHTRVIDHQDPANRRKVLAFGRAAGALEALRGQTLGLFGGRSLGILTAVADPAQWQRLFGVDIEYVDQLEIKQLAETLPAEAVQQQANWLASRLGGIQFQGAFTSQAYERQVRSYLATRELAERMGCDFVGVKCQPELSDGYVTQCVAHLLFNGNLDAGGDKPLRVHACESDADGALTMQILHLISGGEPAALMDVRWFHAQRGLWTLANCGAVPAAFFASQADPSGLSALQMQEHAFGLGGGGALAGVVAPQSVSLARLCRKNGQYWMAILAGEVVPADADDLARLTPAFPKAFVRTNAGAEFLQVFGSNHIHLVSGDYIEELVAFCRLAGIEARIW